MGKVKRMGNNRNAIEIPQNEIDTYILASIRKKVAQQTKPDIHAVEIIEKVFQITLEEEILISKNCDCHQIISKILIDLQMKNRRSFSRIHKKTQHCISRKACCS